MCDFTTNAKYTLRNHKESHHEGKRYYCDKCDFFALYKTSLNRHIKNRHVNVPYPCTKCSFSALNSVRLRKHIRNHHGSGNEKEIQDGKIKIIFKGLLLFREHFYYYLGT